MVGDWSVEGDHIRLNTDVTGVIRMPFKIPSPSSLPDNTVPLEVAGLVISRNEARKNKDFKRSDELRKCIEGHGWSVKDTPKGATLKRIIP